MTTKLELKAIAKEAVPRAIEKAERYRLLNQPFLAESICLDVLAVDVKNHEALVCYVLALTDQFAGGAHGNLARAREAIGRLPNEYDRLYYSGLVCERRGQAYAESTTPGARDMAWGYLTEAMSWYDKAHAARHDSTNDDATLRWNTCVRLIQSHGITEPARETQEHSLE